MNVRLSVAPSFSEGFALEINNQGTADAPEYIIKTKGLAKDAFVRLAQLESLFAPIRTIQPLAPGDAAPLIDLVLAVRISPAREEWLSMDGTTIALSIERGDTLIALEWNSESPETWSGINELVAYLSRLYPLYRHLRDPKSAKA